MPRVGQFLAAAALILCASTAALAQFGNDRTGTRTSQSPEERPLSELEQKFPVLQPNKKPILLRPARPTLVIKAAHRGDATMKRLRADRKALLSSIRAAKRVGDRKAMAQVCARLERLRLKRLARLRQISEPVIKIAEMPMIPGQGPKSQPTKQPMPILPIPTLPDSKN